MGVILVHDTGVNQMLTDLAEESDLKIFNILKYSFELINMTLKSELIYIRKLTEKYFRKYIAIWGGGVKIN